MNTSPQSNICPSSGVRADHCQCAACNPNFIEEFLSDENDGNTLYNRDSNAKVNACRD